jgi:hypothetical protein
MRNGIILWDFYVKILLYLMKISMHSPLRYKAWHEVRFKGRKKWLWVKLWKIKAPPK